jgi:hypothetical protein
LAPAAAPAVAAAEAETASGTDGKLQVTLNQLDQLLKLYKQKYRRVRSLFSQSGQA